MSNDAGFPPPSPPATPSVLIEVLPSPKPSRRRGRWAAAMVVLAVLVAGGAFALLRDRGDGGDTATPQFSLAAAVDRAATYHTAAFDMDIELAGQRVLATGAMDLAAQLMSVEMEMSSLVPGTRMVMIVDIANFVVFMNMASLGDDGLGVDTEWLRMDMKAIAERTGADGAFDDLPVNNPLDATPLFAQGTVTDLGRDDVNGEAVEHFRIAVDTEAVLATNPQLQQLFDDVGDQLPDTVTYDVFVTESNELRRIRYEVPLGSERVRYDITFRSFGEPVDITLPSDDETTDFVEMIEAMTGG